MTETIERVSEMCEEHDATRTLSSQVLTIECQLNYKRITETYKFDWKTIIIVIFSSRPNNKTKL